VGVTEAIIIQQLHYHLADPDNGRIHDGEQWIYKTYDDWQEDDFPFLGTYQIQRIFLKLEKKKLIVSCQPEGRNTRRKYYRIDYEGLDEFLARAHGRSQNRIIDGTKIARSSCAETTCTKSTNTKGMVSHKSSESHAVFVPKVKYPETQEEMYDTLERLGISIDPDHDGNFFEQMQASDWTIQGEPVWDWPATYQARLEVTLSR
jgi:DNA-binding PadR family transcriptional regulator